MDGIYQGLNGPLCIQGGGRLQLPVTILHCISFSEEYLNTSKANSADPDEMAQIVPSHLGLHCLSKSLFRKELIVSITLYKSFPIKT